MHSNMFSLQHDNEKDILVLVQGRSPELILQLMKSADRLKMPKTLACCERHVAIGASSRRTEAFWEEMPACSFVRIAKGLDAAHENLKAQAISKIGPLVESLAAEVSNYPAHADNEVDMFKEDLHDIFLAIKLNKSVPPCKAFLEMAEPVSSKTDPSEAELIMSDSSEA